MSPDQGFGASNPYIAAKVAPRFGTFRSPRRVRRRSSRRFRVAHALARARRMRDVGGEQADRTILQAAVPPKLGVNTRTTSIKMLSPSLLQLPLRPLQRMIVLMMVVAVTMMITIKAMRAA